MRSGATGCESFQSFDSQVAVYSYESKNAHSKISRNRDLNV